MLWRIDDPVVPWNEPKELLPSDSSNREDRNLMIKGDEDAA